jgi:hypothetical protein
MTSERIGGMIRRNDSRDKELQSMFTDLKTSVERIQCDMNIIVEYLKARQEHKCSCSLCSAAPWLHAKDNPYIGKRLPIISGEDAEI